MDAAMTERDIKIPAGLPALKRLGELAQRLPTVIIDTREQEPLPIKRLPQKRGGLYSGDYSVAGLEESFAVERKSIPDLVSCCCKGNRDRFERELHRLRGFAFRRLLIVGKLEEIQKGDYRSQIEPSAVTGTLAAFEVRYGIPIVFFSTPEIAARQVERWAWYAAKEAIKTVNNIFRGSANVDNR